MKPIWSKEHKHEVKKHLSGYVNLSQWYYDGETTERKKWKAWTKDKNIVFSSLVYLSSLYHVIAMCILIRVYVVSFPNFFHWLPLPYFYIRKLLKFKIIVFLCFDWNFFKDFYSLGLPRLTPIILYWMS